MYSCGSCGLEVLDNHQAVECDTCMHWFHIECENMSNDTYNELVARDCSSWLCSGCDSLNVSSQTTKLSNISSENSFKVLENKFKVFYLNYQSIVKKAEFYILLEQQKPHLVISTESWLSNEGWCDI